MNRLSGSQALAAGFGLVRREPAAVLVWSVVAFVLGVAPQVLSIGPTLAMLDAISRSGDPSSAEVLAAQAQVMRFQPISYLAGLAMLLVLPGAVFRAVLFPEDRAAMYLRIGGREFWLTLIVILLFVIWMVAFAIGMIPSAIFIGIAGVVVAVAGASSTVVAVLLGVLLMFGLFGVSLWVILRFSMAPVMAFADNTFRLTESWSLTRGHAWKMFLVGVVLMLIVLVVELVVFGGLVVWAAMMVPLETFGSNPGAALTQLGAPWLAVATVLASLFYGVSYAVWGGAWADMYRQLSDKPADVF